MAELRVGARLAVLIDADNVKVSYLESVLEEIAKYGTATVRRAYGDWSSSHLSAWKAPLLKHSVQPMQQFAYTKGKNSTDMALVIDAMDLLHSGTVDGFCLVTSDSDFTRLAARVREQGLDVYGFGERKTPAPLVSACTKFIYVENTDPVETAPTPTPAEATKSSALGKEAPSVKTPPMPNKLLAKAVESAADDEGWAHLGTVGANLSRLKPDFDSRTWGRAKLADLFRQHPGYEVEVRSPGNGKSPNAFVKRRGGKS